MIYAFIASAFAVDLDDKPFSVDAFAASTRVVSESWDRFSDERRMPAYGFRLGLRPARRLVLQGGWAAVRKGSSVNVGDFSGSAVAAATAHQFTVGAKVDANVADVLYPSVGVNGVALPVRWRFDGDPERADDPTQVQANGTNVGIEILGGAEIRVPPGEVLAVAAWFELGGAVYSRAAMDDLGEMQPGGFVARGGVGVRF